MTLKGTYGGGQGIYERGTGAADSRYEISRGASAGAFPRGAWERE
jgi:hypothetical protein